MQAGKLKDGKWYIYLQFLAYKNLKISHKKRTEKSSINFKPSTQNVVVKLCKMLKQQQGYMIKHLTLLTT